MRVLVTGTEGYLGCLLAPAVMSDGHDVVGLDTGFYKSGWLYNGALSTPHTEARDIRNVRPADLRDFDAVIHLAELSNDPIGELIGDVTHDINRRGSVHLARCAKAAGVSRFIYMSSCSVYGLNSGTVDETSAINPLTVYAKCKALVERDLNAMADESFSPTILRNATAFGASPRMRFDVVLNNLCGLAWTEPRIAMTSDGTPLRPLVHTLDIARAVRCVLGAGRERVHAITLNVGADENNYTVREIAETVQREFPSSQLSFGPKNGDERSYRVSFARIREILPEFHTEWDAAAGAAQLHRVFDSIAMDSDTFYSRGYTRLRQIEYLLKTGQIDDQLYWRASQ